MVRCNYNNYTVQVTAVAANTRISWLKIYFANYIYKNVIQKKLLKISRLHDIHILQESLSSGPLAVVGTRLR